MTIISEPRKKQKQNKKINENKNKNKTNKKINYDVIYHSVMSRNYFATINQKYEKLNNSSFKIDWEIFSVFNVDIWNETKCCRNETKH